MSVNKNPTIKKLAKKVQANPDDSFSKFALALEFLKADDFTKAQLFFEDIYQNDPEYVGVYYHLGKLYEQTEEPVKALEMYNEGIEVAKSQSEDHTLKELKEAKNLLEME